MQIRDPYEYHGKYCGYHSKVFAFFSASNVMYIRFVSDAGVNNDGFVARYQELEGKK